jgi:hypothetical protein
VQIRPRAECLSRTSPKLGQPRLLQSSLPPTLIQHTTIRRPQSTQRNVDRTSNSNAPATRQRSAFPDLIILFTNTHAPTSTSPTNQLRNPSLPHPANLTLPLHGGDSHPAATSTAALPPPPKHRRFPATTTTSRTQPHAPLDLNRDTRPALHCLAASYLPPLLHTNQRSWDRNHASPSPDTLSIQRRRRERDLDLCMSALFTSHQHQHQQ